MEKRRIDKIEEAIKFYGIVEMRRQYPTLMEEYENAKIQNKK